MKLERLLRLMVGVAILQVGLLMPWTLATAMPADGVERNLFYVLAAVDTALVITTLVCYLRTPQKWVALALGATAVQIVSYYFKFPFIFWDYRCYEAAARNLIAGRDPYDTGQLVYVYPPPLAQALAGAYRICGSWQVVYDGFQGVQLLACLACVWLTYRWLCHLQVAPVKAAGITALVYLVSSPLLENVYSKQVNVFVLLIVLGFLLQFQRAPFLAGLLAASSVLFKPYALALPLVRRRSALGLLAGAGVVGLLLLTAWREYVAFLPHFPVEHAVQNIALNNLAGVWVQLAAALVLMYRMLRRDRSRAVEQICDLLALTVICSPKVWAHHLVVLIPIFACILARQRTPVRIALAVLALLLNQAVRPGTSLLSEVAPWLGLALALPLTGAAPE
ncbi:MAG: glycosyltransferase 87 family protein [Candidatus Xenobia bacterium]